MLSQTKIFRRIHFVKLNKTRTQAIVGPKFFRQIAVCRYMSKQPAQVQIVDKFKNGRKNFFLISSSAKPIYARYTVCVVY